MSSDLTVHLRNWTQGQVNYRGAKKSFGLKLLEGPAEDEDQEVLVPITRQRLLYKIRGDTGHIMMKFSSGENVAHIGLQLTECPGSPKYFFIETGSPPTVPMVISNWTTGTWHANFALFEDTDNYTSGPLGGHKALQFSGGRLKVDFIEPLNVGDMGKDVSFTVSFEI